MAQIYIMVCITSILGDTCGNETKTLTELVAPLVAVSCLYITILGSMVWENTSFARHKPGQETQDFLGTSVMVMKPNMARY
jgi:hypothetical protein